MDTLAMAVLAQIENLLGVVIALVVLGGSVILRRYLEQSQADRERERRRQQKPRSRSGQTTSSGRSRVFYGRPGEKRPTPPHSRRPQQAAPRGQQTPQRPAQRGPQARQGAMRPTPIRRAPRPAPSRPQTGRPTQPARARRPMRREAEEEEIEIVPIESEEEARPVEPSEGRSFGRPSAIRRGRVGTLRGHSLGAAGLTSGLAATARPVRTEPGPSYLGDMLRAENLGRAFILSEIFGPPKSLR
jgi:hypothetical protein